MLFPKPKDGGKLEEDDEHDPNKSHHEMVEHPNIAEDAEIVPEEITPVVIGSDGKPVKKVSCIKILKRADTEIIKPLLIYNYESA